MAFETPFSVRGENQTVKGEIGEAVEVEIFGGVLKSIFDQWNDLIITDWDGLYEDLDAKMISQRFWTAYFFHAISSSEKVNGNGALSKTKSEWLRSPGPANAACGENPQTIKKRRAKGPRAPTGVAGEGDVFR